MKRQCRILDSLKLSFDLPFSNGESNSAWHQIALEGSWEGHWQGAFSITSRMQNEFVQNFRASKLDIPVYRGHADMFGGEGPAAAWISEMETRQGTSGTETWAKFDYTESGAQQVRAKEFRYLSPSIVFNSFDRKSGAPRGAMINSVALTNQPFLEELPEVRLNSSISFFNDTNDEEFMTEEQLKQLAKSLGLSNEKPTPEDILGAADRVSHLAQRGFAALTAFGLKPESTNEEISTRAALLSQPQQGYVSMEQFQQLQQQLQERDASDAVKQALSEGKLTGPDTPLYKWALDLAKRDMKAFTAWREAAQPVVPVNAVNPDPNNAAGNNTALTSAQRNINEQLGLSEENFKKYVNK